ncbi:hypothetical protein HPB50_013417 [Hyalomma asiaticum]|uniref:Uncharacterized protein n=1 Tax=Hyalomma asiaticum TaxID=266040 RepID=A0ACB7RKM7_HYAAI|nr:hypothetical protein HPB50_013417 [Hyalomma asiaticum]
MDELMEAQKTAQLERPFRRGATTFEHCLRIHIRHPNRTDVCVPPPPSNTRPVHKADRRRRKAKGSTVTQLITTITAPWQYYTAGRLR